MHIMQTFLPYSSFVASSRALDNLRLGKQRVETLQILKALRDPTYGWQHHPAKKMWEGFDHSLILYGTIVCCEWQRRGFKDTVMHKLAAYATSDIYNAPQPKWLGDDRVHSSHRSNLIFKDPPYYKAYGWTDSIFADYYWPV